MPTFRSIGLHPELRSRLVTQAATGAANKNGDGDRHHLCHQHLLPESSSSAGPQQPQPQPQPSYQPVDTPLALLARHPRSLRVLAGPSASAPHSFGDGVDDAVAPPPQIAAEFRHDVARALVGKTLEGRRIRRVRELLAATNRRELAKQTAGRKRPRDNDENALTRSISNASAPGNHEEGAVAEKSRTTSAVTDSFPTLMSPCTLSALEMMRFEASMTTVRHPTGTSRHLLGIPTGCRTLDALLALPPEYRHLSTALQLDRPSPGAGAPDLSDSSAGGGVPFGYVTQFYGPPASGKTQLAWQLAAARRRSAPSGGAAAAASAAWIVCRPALAASCAARVVELSRGDAAVAECTRVMPVSDAAQVLAALAQVEEDLQHALEQARDGGAACGGPSLLVLDGASSVLSGGDASSPSDLDAALLHRAAAALKRLARHHRLAVVVTSGAAAASSRRDPTAFPASALGRGWDRAAADLLVRVDVVPGQGGVGAQGRAVVRQCTLVQHPARPVVHLGGPTARSDDTAHFCLDPHRGVVEP